MVLHPHGVSLLPPLRSRRQIGRLLVVGDEAKPEAVTARQTKNWGKEESQIPVFTAFGFSHLGVSSPEVAAEGLEPPTRGL